LLSIVPPAEARLGQRSSDMRQTTGMRAIINCMLWRIFLSRRRRRDLVCRSENSLGRLDTGGLNQPDRLPLAGTATR